MAAKVSTELRGLRAKAALYDELVEQLADTEQQLEEVRRSAARDGIDPAWREIANALVGALRPYTLFREQRVIDGRIVVETGCPGRRCAPAVRRCIGWVVGWRSSPTARPVSPSARTRIAGRRDRGRGWWLRRLRSADPAPSLARLRRAAPGVQRARNGRAPRPQS